MIDRSPAPVKKWEASLRVVTSAAACSEVQVGSREDKMAVMMWRKSARRMSAHLPRSLGVSPVTRAGRVPVQTALRYSYVCKFVCERDVVNFGDLKQCFEQQKIYIPLH